MPNLYSINSAEINGGGIVDLDLRVSMPSPLTPVDLTVFHDWSSIIPDSAQINYVMDIIGTATTRIPISSWQGTLQLNRSSFLQAVVPACEPYLATITAEIGSPFAIYRTATFDGLYFEQEIARSLIETPRTDRGPINYTCTIVGYESQFSTLTASATTDRVLTGVRSISTYNSGIRVRSNIDWFLKPGQKADANGNEFTVSYINFIVNGADAYMDLGESAL